MANKKWKAERRKENKTEIIQFIRRTIVNHRCKSQATKDGSVFEREQVTF